MDKGEAPSMLHRNDRLTKFNGQTAAALKHKSPTKDVNCIVCPAFPSTTAYPDAIQYCAGRWPVDKIPWVAYTSTSNE